MKTNRKQRILILVCSSLVIILIGVTAFFFAIPRVGYCFDTAFNETGTQLFVTAGDRGLHIFSVDSQGRINLLSTYNAGGYYRYMEISGNFAYIANSYRGLEVLDIRQETPTPVWSQLGSKGYGIHIRGDRLFLASNEYGLQVFDVSDPSGPRLLGVFPTSGRVWDVWIDGDYAYLADHDRGLIVVDLSTPSAPWQVGALSWGDEPQAEIISGAGGCVYIAAGLNGLIVVDVSDPTQPVVTYQYDPGRDSHAEAVLVQGGILYLSMNDSLSTEYNGLHVFDVREPSLPRLLGRYPLWDGVEGIAIAGSRLAVANSFSGLVLFDVQTPGHPVVTGTYPSQFWRSFTRILR